MPKLMASCVAGCLDEMEVNSVKSERVREARQSVTELDQQKTPQFLEEFFYRKILENYTFKVITGLTV